MKVCLLGYHEKFFWPGSATLKVQRNVHKYLNLNSIETDLFVCAESKNSFSVLFDSLKICNTNNGRIISGGVIPFLRHLALERYDIIHLILTRNYMVIVTLFSFLYKSKILVTFHDTLIFPSAPKLNLKEIKLFIVKWMLFKTSNILFIYNENDLKIFSEKYPKKKVVLIKNGVEEIFFDSKNDGMNKSIILFSGGRKNSYKGYEFLINALKKTHHKFQLLTCGYGDDPNSIENSLGELSLEKFRKILTEIGVLVIPSSYDSFNITALESMASGTPVIMTTRCGVSKYIKNGEGCFIINYGDEESFAQKIDSLIHDTILWDNMSQVARIIALKFLWSAVILDYKIYYLSTEE
jgi:glycosyltransferase involved in cell wall biosynthesis